MRWSLEVARLAGIPLRIHATFLLVVAWVAWVQWRQEPNASSVALAVLFLLAVFAVVVIHELSHALTARLFGIGTRDIVLWPIGGVSRLESMPKEPLRELLIALAGPATNVVLAALLGGWILLTRGPVLPSPDFSVDFLGALLWANLVLAFFNLLPAFPMDGGRALRAFLGLFTDRVQATRVAAVVGRVFAGAIGLLGLWVGNPFLILIAAFVWLGAGAEAGQAQLEAGLAGRRVDQALSHPPSLRGEDPLSVPAELVISAGQRAFPVLVGGEVAGVLGERELFRGLSEAGPGAPTSRYMRQDAPRAARDEPLASAWQKLQAPDGPPCVLVEDHGRLVGVVTPAGIAHLLAVEDVMNRPRTPRVQE